ncbi:MAG: hypothetical protein WCO56_22460 [Verrucomicrobiota bacterium]
MYCRHPLNHVRLGARLRAWLAGVALLALALTLPTARLHGAQGKALLADGKTFEGDVTLPGGDQLVVGGTRLDLKNLAHLSLTKAPASKEPFLPPAEPDQPNGAIPSSWQFQDIGKAKQPGGVVYRLEQRGTTNAFGTFGLRSCGMTLSGKSDSCLFAYKTLKGNGEIIARVVGLEWKDSWTMGGVMIRAALTPESQQAAMAITAGEGAACYMRKNRDTESQKTQSRERDIKYPHWVKLERRGNQFTAFRSKDGATWEFLETAKIEMPETVFAGLFTLSRRETALTTTRIAQAYVIPKLAEEYMPRLMMADGSTLAGQLNAAEAPTIRFVCARKTFSLNTGEVARLLFQPLPPDAEEKIKSGRPGFFLRRNEFVAGQFRSYEAGLVKGRVYGKEVEYRAGLEVSAVVFRDIAARPAAFELRTVDGDVIFARMLWLGKRSVTVELEDMGTIEFAEDAIAEIRRLGSVESEAPKATAPPVATTGRVQTTDGKQYEGDLKFEAGGLKVIREGQPELRLEVNQIQQLTLPPHAKAGGAESTQKVGPTWKGMDLGRTQARGSHSMEGTRLAILGGGDEISKNNDSFYYVYNTLEGSGDITVQVTSILSTNEWAKAGLMLRDKLEPNSKNFYVALTYARGLVFQWRGQNNGYTEQNQVKDIFAPVWLKLERDGKNITGLYSQDGQKWTTLGTDTVDWPDKLHIGVAVCSRNPTMLCRSTFDGLTTRSFAPVQFKPRIILRSGTEIPCSINSADDTAVKFSRVQKEELSVSTLNVARLYFQPVKADQTAAFILGRTGLLLRNGDFVDGDFRSLDRETIKLSSVVLGLRTFKTGDQAAALSLHEVAAEPAPYEILLEDGTKICAQALDLKDTQFEAKESVLEKFTFAARDVVEIRRRP